MSVTALGTWRVSEITLRDDGEDFMWMPVPCTPEEQATYAAVVADPEVNVYVVLLSKPKEDIT